MENTPDPTNQTPDQQVELFENLLTQYEHQLPQPGEVLQAMIIQIDKDGILVDIGIKRDSLIPARDLSRLDPAYLDQLAPGMQIPAYVIGHSEESGELQLSLSKGLEDQLWEKAEKLMQDSATLNLDVLGHNRGGLIIRFESLRGFLPFSLVPDLQGVRSPKRADAIKNGLVGRALPVKITEVDRTRNRLILSAEAAQKELLQKRFEEIKKGQILTGKVVKILDFGVFVDLGTVDGLVHITQLSWKKPTHPSEVVKLGDEIEVKIIDVDVERQRISLSRKAMLPGPWQTIDEDLKAGDYVEGVVTRLVDFGAFVKLPVGVEGLVHTSQIGYSSSQNPQSAIKPGDPVLLKVLEVNSERKRVALSMRQVPVERQIAWSMGNLEAETATTPKPEARPVTEPLPESEPPADHESITAQDITAKSGVETDSPSESSSTEVSEANLPISAEPVSELPSLPESNHAQEPEPALDLDPTSAQPDQLGLATEPEPEQSSNDD